MNKIKPKIDPLVLAYVATCVGIVYIYTQHVKKTQEEAEKLNKQILKTFQDAVATKASEQ